MSTWEEDKAAIEQAARIAGQTNKPIILSAQGVQIHPAVETPEGVRWPDFYGFLLTAVDTTPEENYPIGSTVLVGEEMMPWRKQWPGGRHGTRWVTDEIARDEEPYDPVPTLAALAHEFGYPKIYFLKFREA